MNMKNRAKCLELGKKQITPLSLLVLSFISGVFGACPVSGSGLPLVYIIKKIRPRHQIIGDTSREGIKFWVEFNEEHDSDGAAECQRGPPRGNDARAGN